MLIEIVFYAGMAGITVFLGAVLAMLFNHHVQDSPVKYEVTHTLMSFGAGIILSAVALVLVPKGLESLSLMGMASSFLLGALFFMWFDQRLAKSNSQSATLMAMLMDFIPESIALGAVFAIEPKMAALLAMLIGLQNLPEAFNSFRDLVQSGFSEKLSLVIFFVFSFFGIAGALLGHLVLSHYPDLTAHLMTFASGGIIYLLVQDIIPESKLSKNYLTSLGATLGFLLGMVGKSWFKAVAV